MKVFEEQGDALTAEAYRALEALPYAEFIHITEQFVKHLDDIVDGINDTAHEILVTLLSMIARLQIELARFPENDYASVKVCREAIKRDEESADLINHNWRKKQYRILVLPLVDEANWTEILGTLEKTTDSACHAALLLERMTRYRLRH